LARLCGVGRKHRDRLLQVLGKFLQKSIPLVQRCLGGEAGGPLTLQPASRVDRDDRLPGGNAQEVEFVLGRKVSPRGTHKHKSNDSWKRQRHARDANDAIT
jgi:hypothetical protein